MSTALTELEHRYMLQTYKRLPVEIESASGMQITDKEGKVYIDFLGGIAVNVLGHSHPVIIKAVENQIKKYMHVSNYFYQDAQIRFAQKLSKISGYNKIFLNNSGTESTEGAIKLVRRWSSDKDKSQIIAFTGGFHGRTYGALSLMDKPHYKDKMGPFLDNMAVIGYNDITQLKSHVDKHTSALLLEFIQGEGGIATADRDWINEIIRLKHEFGFLIIADEIQAGTGRTGKFFSFEDYNIRPDIVTLAKGIGGGLPLGCILVADELSDIFEKGMHGTTFGGNPVACAAGEVVLDELNNGLMKHINEIGDYFDYHLNNIKSKFPDKILQVRGKGLMKGLLLSFDANVLVVDLLKKGYITNAASGAVLRLVPPFIVDKANIDKLTGAIESSLQTL